MKVVTHNGRRVERAIVKLQDPKTLVVRSFITRKNGRYHFAGLRTDVDYQVWTEQFTLKSSKEYCSRFDADPTPTKDLSLD